MIFDVPWKVPVPVMLKGHVSVPFLAVPVAAQGIDKFHDIRGDAYAAKGDSASAKREFEAALAAGDEAVGVDRAFIELKRDATPLAVAAAPAAPAAPASSAAPAAEASGQ